MTHVISLDVETTSLVDLKKVGAARLADDPSTFVTTFSWSIDGTPPKTWMWGDPTPADLFVLAADPTSIWTAWNSAFERLQWAGPMTRQFPGLPPIPVDRWRCSMVRCLYWGGPPSLEDAGDALGAIVQKDKGARDLMLRMARPRARDPLRWWHVEDRGRLKRLARYCARDVTAEQSVAARLPALPPKVQRQWELDQVVNDRGLKLDLDLVERMIILSKGEQVRLNQEIARLTNDKVETTNQTARIMSFLQFLGSPLENLQRGVVEERLEVAKGLEAQILQIRLDASRASTKKLDAMKRAVCADGRVHHSLQYYGSHTGRSAGRIVQPQNLARPLIDDVDFAIEGLAAGHDWELLEIVHGVDPLSILASCIRGCITAEPGSVLCSGDFSQIEARVTSWLAGQHDALQVFADPKQDIYTFTARAIGSESRQLGKVLVLACGFGMGWRKFQLTAKGYGLILTDQEAQSAVEKFRRVNSAIVRLWYALDDAARAVAQGHVEIKVGFLIVSRRGKAMVIQLPSGRELIYRNIRLRREKVDDEVRMSIAYDGYWRGQWTTVRTWGGTLTENVVQAVAYDLLEIALTTMEHLGLNPILTVHDEVVCEVPESLGGSVKNAMLKVMEQRPAWAKTLPIRAAGWVKPRYQKG